jgi:chemotaxis protein methyltransferase CheR
LSRNAPAAATQPITLTDAEFAEVRAFAMSQAGISLNGSKKALVVGRWGKRLAHHGFTSFRQYLDLLRAGSSREELQISLDLLTTNETYFFREPQHFDFLRTEVLPKIAPGQRLRVWSAACSSGEEPYSIAMLLAAELTHSNWEVLGSDISTRVLASAGVGLYDMVRAQHIPPDYLRRFCLKGTGPHEGKLLVDRAVKDKVHFRQVNLNETLPNVGEFDVILLRNVMIYFDTGTKSRIVDRLQRHLRPGGHLLIGHCDTLHGVEHRLTTVKPSVYRKPT